jgi:hypothetical protein
MSSVFESTERELEQLGVAGSALAAVALAMAEQIDGPGSATSKSMCAKVLADVLRELRALAPPKRQEDRVDEIAKRRQDRLSAAAG